MTYIDDLIEFENENTNLDFKRDEYTCNENEKLVKDIMAMANSSYNETSYIIVGVKAEPGKEKLVVGIDQIRDQADLENVIQENIEPLVNFKYYQYSFSNKHLGIIEIFNNIDPPYMMRKDLGSLKKGDMWIRKGSRQSRLTREDLDRLMFQKEMYIHSDNIKLGFDNNLAQKKGIIASQVDINRAPSSIKKREYELLLGKLNEYINTSKNKLQNNNTTNPTINQLAQQLNAKLGDYYAEKESIVVGRNEFGSPVYCNKLDLTKRIENCKYTFSDDDYFFIFEENSIKLNFSILNDGNQFLEDVEIKLWFDKSVFSIATRKPVKPKNRSIFDSLQQMHQVIEITGYPEVKDENDMYIVESSFSQIRHKEITPVFDEYLRVLSKKGLEGEYSIHYQITAKNIPNPIKGNLIIEIKSTSIT